MVRAVRGGVQDGGAGRDRCRVDDSVACNQRCAGVGLAGNRSAPPASGRTGVDGNTQFQWAGDDSVVVLHVESVPRYQGMYIITTAKSLKLPDVGGGFFLVKGEEHWWQVEAHGSYTSVDQVAKAGGFISTFAADRTEPRYYKAADQGYFSASDALGFTTAP